MLAALDFDYGFNDSGEYIEQGRVFVVLSVFNYNMIILENQDEQSPLKTEGEINTTAAQLALPPPYVPTLPPIVPSYQAVSHPHHVTVPRRQLPIRRFLVFFAVACLVFLLCGAFMYGFTRRPYPPFRCLSADPSLCSRTDFFINRYMIPFIVHRHIFQTVSPLIIPAPSASNSCEHIIASLPSHQNFKSINLYSNSIHIH